MELVLSLLQSVVSGSFVFLPHAHVVFGNVIGDSSESPKRFTTVAHKCVSLFWQIFLGTLSTERSSHI